MCPFGKGGNGFRKSHSQEEVEPDPMQVSPAQTPRSAQGQSCVLLLVPQPLPSCLFGCVKALEAWTRRCPPGAVGSRAHLPREATAVMATGGGSSPTCSVTSSSPSSKLAQRLGGLPLLLPPSLTERSRAALSTTSVSGPRGELGSCPPWPPASVSFIGVHPPGILCKWDGNFKSLPSACPVIFTATGASRPLRGAQ